MSQDSKEVRHTTAGDFFLSLGVFASMYVSAISLLRLLFGLIDESFYDALTRYQNYSGSIRWAIASLVVAVPVFLYLSRLIYRNLRVHAEKADIGIRKWLTYLTLFVAGATLAVDLIVLINTFLSGEITARFTLKVLATGAVAGGVFSFYLFDLRRNVTKKTRTMAFSAIAVAIAGGVSIASAFVIIGSPAKARDIALDRERIGHLQTIVSQTVSFWQLKGVLPDTIDDLTDQIRGYYTPVDPETGALYGYNVLGELTFSVCATFARNSEEDPYAHGYTNGPILMVEQEKGDSWEHEVGEKCFERTIDPERFQQSTEGYKVVPAYY